MQTALPCRLSAAVRLCLAAVLSLLIPGNPTALTSEVPDNIGTEVREALARSESVRVILFLVIPEVPPARMEEEVSRVQESVLGFLGPKEFVVGHRYRSIPALAGEITVAGLEKLAGHPRVLRVDLDAPTQAHLAESVPLIRGNQIQALGYGGQGVTVAILDTGVDTDHPDLADDLVGQECFCTGGCCPNGSSRQSGTGAAEDGDGHGTNVAGIVTSKGLVSSVGVAPSAKIFAIRVLGNNGSGSVGDTISALDWIYTNRPEVKVVNMSLGAGLFSGNCDSATSWTLGFASAINNLRNRGTITFASAGNDGSGTQMAAPGCIANAISVGAVYDANSGGWSYPNVPCTDTATQADMVACFSNSNSTTDVFAPGARIRSDGKGGTVSFMHGTSQASPHAAGCAADLLSAAPSLTPAEIEATLEASGVPVTNPRNSLTFPRIDCLGALQNLGACIDRDHDGYGQPGSAECLHGAATDCDDTRASVYPGAPQICDGLNNDCSAPGWPTVPSSEVDQDGDTRPLCGDCNDLNATVYPGAPQICDGINNDCNAPGWPAVPSNEIDSDGDTHLACADCNDASAAVYPGAPQVCDGINNNCGFPGWPTLVGTNERDDDGDTFTECQGDCNDMSSATYPGAPQICDGNNNNCSAPGWPSILGTNETDDDGDSFTECQGDCDDLRAAIHPGAAQICDGLNNNCLAAGWPSLAGTNDGDDDSDSFTECQGDCDDLRAAVRPGAPQVCDSLNNDCLSPSWPGVTGTNEYDDDGDTFSECQADCDDTDANTCPGALESNDGRDNQCPTYAGYGSVDEISGAVSFSNPSNPEELSWPAQPAATAYEAVRSGNPSFPPVCGNQLIQVPSWSDPAVPAPGGVFFYLVRPVAPHLGSWGRRSSGAERAGLCGAEANCSDGLDNDGDGQTDCDDPDCYQAAACVPPTFTFVDTAGDDIAPAALADFFASIAAAPTEYLFFSISGPGVIDFSWCAERADFYRDSYLALSMAGGTVSSGAWNRWSLLEGGSWVGPDTTGYLNRFGAECAEVHAWCSESGLSGRDATLLPEEVNECEAVDFMVGCGTGNWVFTLKVGPRRLATCGF